jgi:hypothetical protein
MCCHVFQILIISNIFIINLEQSKIYNFYAWMVLGCNTWCNRNLQCGILIEFVQNKLKPIFMYLG